MAIKYLECLLSAFDKGRKRGVVGLSAGALFWLLWCSSSAFATELITVRLVLQWEHQAQFAGYYLALEQGYYAEEGLDVEILAGGPHVDPLRMVNSGTAEFATTMLSSALATEENGSNLVLLRQLINRSNLMLIAWKDGRHGTTPIRQPADLNGTTITLWEGFRPAYLQFLHRYEVDARILPQYYNLSLFLHRGADASCAMRYNEYHVLHQSGIDAAELTVFDFHQLGINLPEDGIYTRRSFWQEQPETAEAFARASMRGWEHAHRHPDEALDLVMTYVQTAKLPVNRTHMHWMLDTVLDSIFPAKQGEWVTGKLSPDSYQQAVRILQPDWEPLPYRDFITPGARHAID